MSAERTAQAGRPTATPRAAASRRAGARRAPRGSATPPSRRIMAKARPGTVRSPDYGPRRHASFNPAQERPERSRMPDSKAASRRTVLLDEEAIGRAVRRIAHEIAERNEELDRLALIGIHTRGVPLAQRLRRALGQLGGAPPRRSARSTSRFTVTTSTLPRRLAAPPRATARPVDAARLSARGPHLRARGRRALHRAHGAGCDRGPVHLRAARARAARRARRPRPPRAADRPDYVDKNMPTAPRERVEVELVEVDEVDRVLLVGARSSSEVSS